MKRRDLLPLRSCPSRVQGLIPYFHPSVVRPIHIARFGGMTWLAVGVLFAVGCQPSSTTASNAAPDAPTTSASKPNAPALGPALEGADYYGLLNSKPVKMEIRFSTRPGYVGRGTQTTTLKEKKEGVSVYKIERTGDLAVLGSQEIRCEADGLYNSASTIAKIGPHDLEMPAKLRIGDTWKSHEEVDQPSAKMTIDSVYKVVGIQKQKTKIGDVDALLITSTGSGTGDGKKLDLTSEAWYVKGIGAVKTQIHSKSSDGATATITIEDVN